MPKNISRFPISKPLLLKFLIPLYLLVCPSFKDLTTNSVRDIILFCSFDLKLINTDLQRNFHEFTSFTFTVLHIMTSSYIKALWLYVYCILYISVLISMFMSAILSAYVCRIVNQLSVCLSLAFQMYELLDFR